MKFFFLSLAATLYFPHLIKASCTLPPIESSSIQNTHICPWTQKVTHFQLEGDLLCWVPEASGLDSNFGSGSITQSTIGGNTVTVSEETDTDPTFSWNAGYRVVLKGKWDHNRWEVAGTWTDFHGRGHVARNDGQWKVRLHQIDLASFYNTCLNTSLTLQPFFGVRGTSMWQKLFSQVDTQVTLTGSGIATDSRTFNDRQQFYGFGPLFGLNWDYAINHGLGVYGAMGLALLYGNYHLKFEDTETVTAPATPSQTNTTTKKNMKAFDFNMDLAIGIQWRYLIRDAYYLGMRLGFENHQYFDQSRLGTRFGNVSFSGGIFSLALDF